VDLLLDTHVLLWALNAPERLPSELCREIECRSNSVYFSAASIWEIAIKSALGKLPCSPVTIAEAALETGLIELPITATHAAAVALLPRHHRDPFDRMLVAQASALPAYLVTVDSALAPYSDLVRCITPCRP
jgi:PIN domain nuclease of toxin-antitoxin system